MYVSQWIYELDKLMSEDVLGGPPPAMLPTVPGVAQHDQLPELPPSSCWGLFTMCANQSDILL